MLSDIITSIAKWPWKGEVIGAVVGWVIARIFYVKSKREADLSAARTEADLKEANKKIHKLEMLLQEYKIDIARSAAKLDDIIKSGTQQGTQNQAIGNNLKDIQLVLKGVKQPSEATDEAIGARFIHLYQSGKFEEADEFLELAHKSFVHPSLYYYWKSLVKVSEKQFEKALILLDSAPQTAQTFYNRGFIYLKHLRKFSEAILYLSKAYSLDPDMPEIHHALINAFLSNNQLEEAMKRLTIALEKFPADCRFFETLALFHARSGDGAKGLEYIQKAIELGYPRNQSYGFMGDCYYAIGDLEKAVDCFTQVPVNDHNHKNSLNSTIQIYMQLGRPLDAERNFHIFRKLYPTEQYIAEAHIAILLQIDPKKAIAASKEYDLFGKDARSNITALNFLGLAYLNTEEFDKSEECFEFILSMDPNFIAALGNLGMLNMVKPEPDLDKGYFYFHRLYHEIGDRNYNTLIGLGNCCLARKEYERAYQLFQEGCGLFPDDVNLKNLRNHALSLTKLDNFKIFDSPDQS